MAMLNAPSRMGNASVVICAAVLVIAQQCTMHVVFEQPALSTW
jgi:hypothetical protein